MFGGQKMIQTDLSSFSYKKGSLVPWCKIFHLLSYSGTNVLNSSFIDGITKIENFLIFLLYNSSKIN